MINSNSDWINVIIIWTLPPLSHFNVWQSRCSVLEVDTARNSMKVNISDDPHEGFSWSVTVEVLKISFILWHQLLKCQTIHPYCIIHIPTEKYLEYTTMPNMGSKIPEEIDVHVEWFVWCSMSLLLIIKIDSLKKLRYVNIQTNVIVIDDCTILIFTCSFLCSSDFQASTVLLVSIILSSSAKLWWTRENWPIKIIFY